MHPQAKYQDGILRRCLEREPDVPYPIDHGWVMDAPGILFVDWMSGPVAPENVLEMISCKCARRCTLSDSLSDSLSEMCIRKCVMLSIIF